MTNSNKILLAAALAWAGVGLVGTAAGPEGKPAAAPVAPRTVAATTTTTAPAATPAAPAKAPAEYHSLVNRYCASCHNEQQKIPAGAPLNLKDANLDNPGADPLTWEKVVKKLAVNAMPPQGSAHPAPEKLKAFRTYLIARLDENAAAHLNPGNYLLHRMNRNEYQNAVRDLFNMDVDVSNLLPGDSADFGFDNVASALNTSPLLLNRYMTAALRISDMAIGDKGASPQAIERSITLGITQKSHLEGLPLGTRGGILIHNVFPADGEYEVSAQPFRTVLNGYVGIEGHDKPFTYIVTVDGVQVFSAPVGGPEDDKKVKEGGDGAGTGAAGPSIFVDELDKRLTARINITAGPHDIGFTWLDDSPLSEESVWLQPDRDTQEVHMATGRPRLRTATVKGPFKITGISETPSRQRVFVCKPANASQEDACANRIVATLAKRAFRRPVATADIQPALAFYTNARKSGGDFDAGIKAAVARVIADPQFLFRAEADPSTIAAGAAHKVTDLELASRLSFFLWSSIPDDELLNIAAAGRLREPGMIEKQVRRMIADKKADALVSNFVGQWLQLRSIEAKVAPDLLLFPNFDDNVRAAFRTETEMFFANVLRTNSSVLDLMNANYTFLDERLARHYGIPGVYGERFRKVTLTDPNRFGLLGQGSILAMNSIATRTSPTIRGKYVMSILLDMPPLPPPPVVPPLEKSAVAGKKMTVRQQVESHRANPVCSSCHRNIDPVGFALENYNPVGQWRDKDGEGLPIDSAGVLVDGTHVNNPVELRKALTKDPTLFATALTKNLMIYALGRGLDPIDIPVVRNVVRKAAPTKYSFVSIITGIAESEPFQMRTKPADPNGPKVAKVAKVAQAN